MSMTDAEVMTILSRLHEMENPVVREPIPRLRIYQGLEADFLTPDTQTGPGFEALSDAEIVATARRIAAEAAPLLDLYDQGWREIRHLDAAFYAEALHEIDLDTDEHRYAWAVFTDQATRDQFVADNSRPVHGIDPWYASDAPPDAPGRTWPRFDATMMLAPGGHHVSTDAVRYDPRPSPAG